MSIPDIHSSLRPILLLIPIVVWSTSCGENTSSLGDGTNGLVPQVSLVGADAEVARVLTDLMRQVESDPRNPQKLGELAMAYEMQGYLDAALKTYRVAESFDDANPLWPYYQALILAGLGDFESALTEIRRSIDLDSQHAAAWLWYATWLLESDQLEEARRSYQTAVVLGEEIHGNIGEVRVLMASGRMREARSLLEELHTKSDYPYLHTLNLRLSREESGKAVDADLIDRSTQVMGLPVWADSRRDVKLKFAVSISSKLSAVRHAVATEELQHAFELIDPLYKRYPEDGRIVATFVDVLRRMGQYEQAIEIATDGIARFENNHVFPLVLAEYLINSGDGAQARPYLEKVIELRPSIDWAHAQLGLLQLQAEEIQAAKKSFSSAIELNSDSYQPHYYLGMAHVMESEWTRAEAAIRESLRLNPEFGVGYLDLARVEGEANEYEAAYEALKGAYENGVDEVEIREVETWLRERQARN